MNSPEVKVSAAGRGGTSSSCTARGRSLPGLLSLPEENRKSPSYKKEVAKVTGFAQKWSGRELEGRLKISPAPQEDEGGTGGDRGTRGQPGLWGQLGASQGLGAPHGEGQGGERDWGHLWTSVTLKQLDWGNGGKAG